MQEQFSSDELVYGLLQVYIKYSRGHDFILSGAVRRKSQIQRLDKVLADIDQQVDKVIVFNLSDDEAVERLSNRLVCKVCSRNYNLKTQPPKNSENCDVCGSFLSKRDDDKPEAIKNRLLEYHKYNDEILEEYEKRGVLVRIDASRSIDQIHTELREVLEELD